jgi:NAD(P)-dependent dehydrogenase (short-subunit alcohol dehydrogenase family)
MKELAGKTAFITGAASGIGLGIARALARAKVDLALSDVEEGPLAAARDEIESLGVKAIAIPLDVADRAQVYAARDTVKDAFGGLHILVNNAGIGYSGVSLDEVPDGDLDWVVGVNVMGVVHGIKAFVPLIKETAARDGGANGGGHIVNTASISGLRVQPGWKHALYSLTKFAVVGASEGLADELQPFGIGVSVLCPAAVSTNIIQAGRNRPEKYGGAYERKIDDVVRSGLQSGMSPDAVGEIVRQAIVDDEFYIVTHLDTRESVAERGDRILAAYDRAERRLAAE